MIQKLPQGGMRQLTLENFASNFSNFYATQFQLSYYMRPGCIY